MKTEIAEPIWLPKDVILAAHAKQINRFGGPLGVRDEGLLESALNRPINRWAYQGGDLADLAAAYAFGIARNHPFIDGNKRSAFTAMMLFLRLNGVLFRPDPAEAVVAMQNLAAGIMEEEGLARWIRDRSPEGSFAR